MHFGKNRGESGERLASSKREERPDSPITVIPGYVLG